MVDFLTIDKHELTVYLTSQEEEQEEEEPLTKIYQKGEC